jgi:hypothetical protein
MKCNVAKFMPGIRPEKLFCGEFVPVIFAFVRYT